MQAIVTKRHQSGRFSATAQAGRIYVHEDDSLSMEDNHVMAAAALAGKKGWSGRWYGGHLPVNGGPSLVFVQGLADPDGEVPDFAIPPKYRR